MEVFLPRGAQQHWIYSRHETSSQRIETEAPITMVMAIGDQTNSSKKQIAEGQAIQYKRRLASLSTAELLRTKFAVIDFMSFVDYGDGVSLPAEVGVVKSSLEGLEKKSVYSGIPNIQYHDQRLGFASDSKTSCERIHGIDVLDNRISKLHLTELCKELACEVPGSTLLLCRSEDLKRVLGSWYWLQDTVPGNSLQNIAVMLIEDFLVQTLTRLHQLNGVVDGGVPTFSQFTTLLSSSAHDLNPEYRCGYHNTEEQAWNKAGCARKNAMKYQGIISDCLGSHIAQSKNTVQQPEPIPAPVVAPTRGGMLPRAAHGTAGSTVARAVSTSPPALSTSPSRSALSTSPSRSAMSTSPGLHSNGSARSNNPYMEREVEAGRHSHYSSQSNISSGKGMSSSSPTSSHDGAKTGSETSWKGNRGNHTRLLSPEFFAVPPKSSSPNSASDDTASSRSVSPMAPSQHSASASPRDAPPRTPADEPSGTIPLPPRRPDKSFSRRNYAKVSEKLPSSSDLQKSDNQCPSSSGSTNYLPGLQPSRPPTPAAGEMSGEVSASSSGDSCLPRRPRSYNNRSKGSEKGNQGKVSDLTYDACVTSAKPPPPVMGNVEKKKATRSGSSTVPSDKVPVPSAASATPVPSAPLGLTLQLNQSASAETAPQMTPPPGFDPIPQYAALPPGFIVAPLPSRINRAALNDSTSSEEYAYGTSAERTQNGHRPAKKRGRN